MSACNGHCQDCPFACHSEVEDGHTPEFIEIHPDLKKFQDGINKLVEAVTLAHERHVVNYAAWIAGYDYEVQP